MKVAYFDCFSGVSGDMFVGALLDAGCDKKALLRGLSQLSVKGYEVRIRKEKRKGFAGTRFDVITPRSHSHWGLREIETLIGRSRLPSSVREKVLLAFRKIAKVEGKAHGIAASKVHFHELGAIDSIVDIVAAAYALHLMKVDRVAASALPLGGGFVQCEHGKIPVPAPGTIGLLKGVPIRLGMASEESAELTTPTGAALLVTWAESIGEPVEMRPSAVGYGVGRRRGGEVPNLLRVVLGESVEGLESDRVYLLETNLDDLSGEMVGYALERLLEAGALDAFVTPIQMKKNRPGVILSALVSPERRLVVEEVFFRETTTIGVRRRLLERTKLPREQLTVKTPLGPISCKVTIGPQGERRISPEYEAVRKIARKTGRPLPELASELGEVVKKSIQTKGF